MARHDHRRVRPVLGVLVGAAIGLALGAGVYSALVPVLEAADGAVRELQGFAWNLVPMSTVAGAVLGWCLVGRSRGRDDGGG